LKIAQHLNKLIYYFVTKVKVLVIFISEHKNNKQKNEIKLFAIHNTNGHFIITVSRHHIFSQFLYLFLGIYLHSGCPVNRIFNKQALWLLDDYGNVPSSLLPKRFLNKSSLQDNIYKTLTVTIKLATA